MDIKLAHKIDTIEEGTDGVSLLVVDSSTNAVRLMPRSSAGILKVASDGITISGDGASEAGALHIDTISDVDSIFESVTAETTQGE